MNHRVQIRHTVFVTDDTGNMFLSLTLKCLIFFCLYTFRRTTWTVAMSHMYDKQSAVYFAMWTHDVRLMCSQRLQF